MILETPAFDGTCDGWLVAACQAIAAGRTPSMIAWQGERAMSRVSAPFSAKARVKPESLPVLFRRLARSVSCHRDPARWDALYAVLWRLVRAEPELLSVVTDPMVHRLVQMHRAVRRASHKMKAFVRFRRVGDDVNQRYVAWFEPTHRVVERTAPFFVRRFPSMRWSILTPDGCAHWDQTALTFSDGVSRDAAPTGDDLEDLWRTYYASTFNPARLNGRAMRTQMPVRYWKELPEARVISELQSNARRRVDEMLAQVFADAEALPEDCLPVGDVPSLLALDQPGDWDPVHDPGATSARRRSDAVANPVRCYEREATRIDLGVAGWTDPTLLAPGVFYPDDCRTPDSRLRYYASRFSMVEVDATYYAMPSRSTASAWAARTPEDFTFDVKAHALMTGHPTDVRRLPDWLRRALPRSKSGDGRVYSHDLPSEVLDEVWRRFRDALEPLRAGGKLGAIMLQYPRWFTPTKDAAAALRRAKELLGDDLATIEFRNRAWMQGRIEARTVALLSELGLSYVVVDAPPGMESSMPPTVAVTNPRLVVFRLHGRRVSTWEAKNDPVTERYRYLYDETQLREWSAKVCDAAFNVARVHMTFNNNHANYATTNALEMGQIFRES